MGAHINSRPSAPRPRPLWRPAPQCAPLLRPAPCAPYPVRHGSWQNR